MLPYLIQLAANHAYFSLYLQILTSVHVTSVDATKIVQTLLEATSVPAILVMISRMITEPVLVRI